ncbi:MAG TPA: threonine ammonia-lyase [Polyangiaceae bacterium]|nr:threonine ammonia-lyase [Polyangiaceae bacterium]
MTTQVTRLPPLAMVRLNDIAAAQLTILGKVRRTPLVDSPTVSELTRAEVRLKLENLQFTGSFKERGACNRLELMPAEERARGVVTASAGNHAQAVARHGARLGVSVTVVMPEATPLVKVTATRRFGAQVILSGANYDEAASLAAKLSAERNAVYLHPFDDPWVIAGQGTVGLEILADAPELDAIVVPVGGGGLIAGVACAVKESNPNVRVLGVEARRFPSMKYALESVLPPALPGGKTIADGIAVRRVGELTRELTKQYVDEIALVDEAEIAQAVLLLLEREKTVVEGAGAVGVAALLHHRFADLEGKRVAVVLSGGNIDVNLISRIIEHGLVQTGRLARFVVTVPDVSGVLAALTRVVADSRANILEINHDRAFSGAELGETLIELVLETHGFEHIADVSDRLRVSGYRFERK